MSKTKMDDRETADGIKRTTLEWDLELELDDDGARIIKGAHEHRELLDGLDLLSCKETVVRTQRPGRALLVWRTLTIETFWLHTAEQFEALAALARSGYSVHVESRAGATARIQLTRRWYASGSLAQ